MKQFSSTTSLLLQERTLFLVVQLLHLRVNYQLLDPNKVLFIIRICLKFCCHDNSHFWTLC